LVVGSWPGAVANPKPNPGTAIPRKFVETILESYTATYHFTRFMGSLFALERRTDYMLHCRVRETTSTIAEGRCVLAGQEDPWGARGGTATKLTD
jgi:hypothetical protein